MTKKELVTVAAESAGVSRKDTDAVLSAVLSAIAQELEKGGEVRLLGFGTFEVRTRKARDARNPRTMEPIKIPAGKVPAFKAGKALKKQIDK